MSSRTRKLQLHGAGPNKVRQEGSHPHQVVLLDETDELLIPDLGTDQVRRLKKISDGTWIQHSHINYELGGGPRHVAYHGVFPRQIMMVKPLTSVNQMASSLRFLNSRTNLFDTRYPSRPVFPSSLPRLQQYPALPLNLMLAAEILITKPNSSFPTPYIYISNRNDPSPHGDSLSIFDFTSSSSQPELIAEVRTGLSHVRGILFGGLDDKYLVAGGVNGGGVKIFERTDGGRRLKEVARNEFVSAPTGFLWK